MKVTTLKDALTILSLLGLPIGGSWVAVAALWAGTKGDKLINIHLLLLIGASVVSAAALAIWYISKQWIKFRKLKAELIDVKKRPHRFQDDFTFDEGTGMYRHKTKPGYFCVACAAENNRESPMKTEQDGWGWSCPVESRHFIKGPNWRMPEPRIQRSPRELGW